MENRPPESDMPGSVSFRMRKLVVCIGFSAFVQGVRDLTTVTWENIQPHVGESYSVLEHIESNVIRSIIPRQEAEKRKRKKISRNNLITPTHIGIFPECRKTGTFSTRMQNQTLSVSAKFPIYS